MPQGNNNHIIALGPHEMVRPYQNNFFLRRGHLQMDLDRVRGVENLTGLEAVHPIAVLILATRSQRPYHGSMQTNGAFFVGGDQRPTSGAVKERLK